MDVQLPAIPAKRYFTIGEVSELCGVKPYVLRYWEQEFTQLKPMKRRGNRRYYQHHEVLLIRRIRDLLYDQGFTISGARNQLIDVSHTGASAQEFRAEALAAAQLDAYRHHHGNHGHHGDHREASRALAADVADSAAHTTVSLEKLTLEQVRDELLAIRESLLA
jgi:DNA-binding transcriptional MerR regulator